MQASILEIPNRQVSQAQNFVLIGFDSGFRSVEM